MDNRITEHSIQNQTELQYPYSIIMKKISSFIALISVALACCFVVALAVARPSNKLKFKPMERRVTQDHHHRFRPRPRGPMFKLGHRHEVQSDNGGQGKCTIVRRGIGGFSFHPERKTMKEECKELCREHEKKTGQKMFDRLFDASRPPLPFEVRLPSYACECCTDLTARTYSSKRYQIDDPFYYY